MMILRVAVTTALILLQIACSGELTSEQHMEKARQFVADSEYNAAIIELKNALQKDSALAEARWLLGKTYLEAGEPASAEKELLRAQELGWPLNDTRPLLARALLGQGRYAAVRELGIEGLTAASAAQLLATQANAELAQGEVEQAQRLIALAIEKQPGTRDPLIRLAEVRVLGAQGETKQAIAAIDELLGYAPELAEAWSLRGDLLYGESDWDGAKAAFAKTLSLSPQRFTDRVKRAMIAMHTQDFETAQADTNLLLEASPQNPTANYISGILQFRTGDYAGAITALSVAEPISANFPAVLFYLGSAHLLTGSNDRAAVYAQQYYRASPSVVEGRVLLAAIRLQQRKPAEVQDLLQPVIDEQPEHIGALKLLANAAMLENRTDEGLELLQRVAQLQPDSAAAQIRLGTGLLIAGKKDEGTRLIETGLELDPQYQQADIMLVMNHAQSGDLESAIEAAEAYRRRNPTSATPHILLGRVFLLDEQDQAARGAFEDALELDPGNPGANHQLAQMAVADGDLATARSYYQSTLDTHPDSLNTLLQLARLDVRENNKEALLAHLEQAIEAHPEELAPRLFLARYYLAESEPEQVAPLFTPLDELQKRSSQVLYIQALAQLAQRQNTDAQYTLEQLLDVSPNDPLTHHLLATAAARTGDREQAEKEWLRAVEIDPDYVPALTELARFSMSEPATDKYDEYFDRVLKLAPEALDTLRLRAAKALRAGDNTGATNIAQQAFATYPQTQTLLELCSYHAAAGDRDESRALLKKWLSDNPQDAPARVALASYHQADNDIDAANKEYANVLEIDANNLIALNNLAWNIRLNNPAKALEYINRAVELVPEQPEILDTLAVIQHLNGEHKRALRNVRRALEKTPDNLSMQYHQAMIEAALGRRESAIASLEELTAPGASPFPDKEEAAALLESLQQ